MLIVVVNMRGQVLFGGARQTIALPREGTQVIGLAGARVPEHLLEVASSRGGDEGLDILDSLSQARWSWLRGFDSHGVDNGHPQLLTSLNMLPTNGRRHCSV